MQVEGSKVACTVSFSPWLDKATTSARSRCRGDREVPKGGVGSHKRTCSGCVWRVRIALARGCETCTRAHDLASSGQAPRLSVKRIVSVRTCV